MGNEAGEEGNKTEEDALVFYRRYGYYPAWYHHRTVTTHVYGDNEAEQGNKTEEDALVFYRRYGYYPTWYHGPHRTVTTTRVYGNKSEKKQQQNGIEAPKEDNKSEED